MDIKEEIAEELHRIIAAKYENSDYTGAIVDAVKHLTDLIRSGADVTGDGMKLVAAAFEGNPPILKFNKMESSSEIDEHKGLTLLLKGIYMGIRNPRSHDIYNDSKEDCDAVIVFLNYLLTRIRAIQNFFDLEKYKERVFDPSFPDRYEYAEILVDEIPQEEMVAVACTILDEREAGKKECLCHFFKATYKMMDPKQQKMLMCSFSEKLRAAHPNREITNLIQYIDVKPDLWKMLDEDAKLRIETLIIESVKEGRYDIYRGLKEGSLGTWAMNLGRYFLLRDDLAEAFIGQLGGDWYTQNYIGNWFVYQLPFVMNTKSLVQRCCRQLCYAAFVNDAKTLKNSLKDAFPHYPKAWQDLILAYALEYRDSDSTYYQQLEESYKEIDLDDIPF